MIPTLRDIVGPAHVLTDADVVASYVVDWTGRFRGSSPAVVRPGTVDELVEVVRVCAGAGASIVPQGGNTGLVGGSIPLRGEVVLSLKRFDSVRDVDPVGGQLTAGAGTPVAAVHAAATAAGWSYAVDLSARESATIGGTVATNAGGLHVLRYGDTRAQLAGVEAVLADSSVVSHLGGLLKDNTGYHFPSLLCGSEGTLGIVTAARLKLVARLDERVTAMLGFRSLPDAINACGALRRDLPALEAAELCFADGLRLVGKSLGVAPPTDAAVALLVDAADRSDPTGALADAVSGLGAADVLVASDRARRAELWRWRELHTEAINQIGPPHKLDVTLAPSTLAAFVDEVTTVVASVAPNATTWLFGHAADGNLHVNVTGVAPDDESVDDAVLTLVARHGGSISAEHGIGTAKKRWLHLNRSEAELAAMRSIKAALDPRGLLNPNVLLP